MKTVDNHTHTEQLLLKIRPRNRISQKRNEKFRFFLFCFRSHFLGFFFSFLCVTRISWHTAPFFLHHSLNNNGKYAESLQTHVTVTAKQEKKIK